MLQKRRQTRRASLAPRRARIIRRAPTRKSIASLPQQQQRIDAPVATTSVQRGNKGPSSASVPHRRREYITDIAGSVGFTTTSFSINPALIATFPWGGQIAPSFEEYEVESISFCYEPESSSASTGAVMLSFDYDALDAAPATKQAALEMSDSMRAAPWVPCQLTLKSADLKKRGTLFTRTGSVANSDLKTYDLGNLYVSTSGQSGTSTIGELWIEYHFRLRVPQLASAATSSFSGQLLTGASVSPSSAFGTTPTSAGSSAVTATVNTITFTRAGDYLVEHNITGSNTTSYSGPSTTGSTATFTEVYHGPSGTVTAWTQAAVVYIVSATAGQTLVLDSSAQAATLTASKTRITAYTYTLG